MAMNEFFAMGGYAAYVWPALAVAALVMAALYIQSHRSLAAREAELKALRRDRSEEDARGSDTENARGSDTENARGAET